MAQPLPLQRQLASEPHSSVQVDPLAQSTVQVESSPQLIVSVTPDGTWMSQLSPDAQWMDGTSRSGSNGGGVERSVAGDMSIKGSGRVGADGTSTGSGATSKVQAQRSVTRRISPGFSSIRADRDLTNFAQIHASTW
jgi:hypothetical protein